MAIVSWECACEGDVDGFVSSYSLDSRASLAHVTLRCCWVVGLAHGRQAPGPLAPLAPLGPPLFREIRRLLHEFRSFSMNFDAFRMNFDAFRMNFDAFP